MVETKPGGATRSRGGPDRLSRVVLVLGGILAGQVMLFGPSLGGTKLLLPLGYLARPGVYLPDGPVQRAIRPQNSTLSDLVLSLPAQRRFATQEVLAGRLPLWNPNQFAGAPAASWGKYSPFSLLYYAFPGPKSLAWIQLAKAVVAGFGAYLFFRLVLAVGFRPALIGAWAYPLTGYFVLWQGFPGSGVVAWLPWMLLATDNAVKGRRSWGGPALAGFTGLTLLSGQADLAAQVLLGSGLYSIWPLLRSHGRHVLSNGLLSVAVLVCAWALGIAIASLYLLPVLEYSSTGSRMQERVGGVEERHPGGLGALPEIVLPELYGSGAVASPRIFGSSNQLEGAPSAYAGLLAALLLAPLALCSSRHRGANTLLFLLALLGSSWVLALPGLTALLRLPGLNLLSHNRLVFLTGFSLLAMAVIGMEVLETQRLRWRTWFLLPVATLLTLLVYCAIRSVLLPEPLATELAEIVRDGGMFGDVPHLATVAEVQQSFTQTYLSGAVLCVLAIAFWIVISFRHRPWCAPVVSVLFLCELLWSGYGKSPQTPLSLYYPRIPVLAGLAEAPPGRVVAIECLPARLAEFHGLRDIRGYDGVDPAALIDLMRLAASGDQFYFKYAYSQEYRPLLLSAPPDRVRLHPLLDMLGVRYLIYRGTPPAGSEPLIAGGDYWVVENPRALPRAFVPRRLEYVENRSLRLAFLGLREFDARDIAYTEVPQPPGVDGVQRGTVAITHELPASIQLTASMETPGLVVLADLWDAGWRATVNGLPAEVERVNHAIRGVRVPAGESVIEMHYEPESFRFALGASVAGVSGVLIWSVVVVRRSRWATGEAGH